MARPTSSYGEAGTEMGVILGTAAYMAPEQARGKSVDRRADIWVAGSRPALSPDGKLLVFRAPGVVGRAFDVGADGERFLVARPVGNEGQQARLLVVLNGR